MLWLSSASAAAAAAGGGRLAAVAATTSMPVMVRRAASSCASAARFGGSSSTRAMRSVTSRAQQLPKQLQLQLQQHQQQHAAALISSGARASGCRFACSATAGAARSSVIAHAGVAQASFAGAGRPSGRLLLTARRCMAESSKKKRDTSGLGGIIAGATLGVMALTTAVGVYTLGAPPPQPPAEPGQPAPPPPDVSPSAWISRAWKSAHQLYQDTMDPDPEPILPEILPYPYRGSDYTLIIDVEDTLIHMEWTVESGWRTVKRPGLDQFLVTCYQLGYEIVLFSEKEVMDTALIMEKMNTHGVVSHKLYRGYMRYNKGELIKDLSLMNRDESKLILVDDNPKSFSKHPQNGLRIKPFKGDPQDRSLYYMADLLVSLRHAELNDVRDVIRTYEGVEDAGAEFERRRAEMMKQQQQMQQPQKQEEKEKDNEEASSQSNKKGWFW